jgi:hypothetical protein
MRKKTLKLVITFRTTTESMAMEKLCKENAADGRMIPVPREISAGCGLAWAADPEEKENLLALMEKAHLQPEDMTECMV